MLPLRERDAGAPGDWWVLRREEDEDEGTGGGGSRSCDGVGVLAEREVDVFGARDGSGKSPPRIECLCGS